MSEQDYALVSSCDHHVLHQQYAHAPQLLEAWEVQGSSELEVA